MMNMTMTMKKYSLGILLKLVRASSLSQRMKKIPNSRDGCSAF
jgi:hypothetical protein